MPITKEDLDEITERNPIEEAMGVLRYSLLEDPEYYYTWQANIAMAFYDVASDFNIDVDFGREGLHEIANEAAKRFLNQLINTK